MTQLFSWRLLPLCCLALGSCKDSTSSEASSAVEDEASAPDSDQVAKAPKKTDDTTAQAETRKFACSAVFSPSGGLSLTLVNREVQDTASYSVWVYMYRDKIHVGRHLITATSILPAGKEVTKEFPYDGNSSDDLECDVSQAVFADGLRWNNPSLVFADSGERPLGGPAPLHQPPASIEWRGSLNDPGHFTLENKTTGRVKLHRAGIFYLDKGGEVLARTTVNVNTILQPQQKLDLTLSVRKQRLPSGTVTIRAFLSEASTLGEQKKLWRDLAREQDLPPEK